jgi:hypothetical protein
MTLSGLPPGSYVMTAEGRAVTTGGTFVVEVDFTIDGGTDSAL